MVFLRDFPVASHSESYSESDYNFFLFIIRYPNDKYKCSIRYITRYYTLMCDGTGIIFIHLLIYPLINFKGTTQVQLHSINVALPRTSDDQNYYPYSSLIVSQILAHKLFIIGPKHSLLKYFEFLNFIDLFETILYSDHRRSVNS